MSPVPFGGSESPPVTISSITLEGVMSVTDTGGVNAPEKKTEKGFAWSSHVDSKPLEVEITAVVPKTKYVLISSLRDDKKPVSASVAQVALSKCIVETLEVENTFEQQSHYQITFTLREVRQSSTDTTTLTVSTGNGQASGSASSERPSFVQSTSDTSGTGQEVQSSGGGDGNFVSDAIGAAATAISDAVGGIF